jgi:hypothetical protein
MTLAQEAQRYLAVVEVFRREGYEPYWGREAAPPAVVPTADSKKAMSHEKLRGA